MSIRHLFFDNIPNIDSLFMEQILFSFENVPIVFVCVDKKENRYLCVCDDIIDEESWLIVKIDNVSLLKILNDDATVLSAFIDKKIIIANRKFRQNIKYDMVEYNSINKDDLPVSDQYLEMKNSLKVYIEKILYDILYSNLKMQFSSDMFYDDFEISNMFILEKKTSEIGSYNDLLVNSGIDDALSSFSNDSAAIEIDCEAIENESSTFTEEVVSIAYAA